jgi:hypothetical protein
MTYINESANIEAFLNEKKKLYIITLTTIFLLIITNLYLQNTHNRYILRILIGNFVGYVLMFTFYYYLLIDMAKKEYLTFQITIFNEKIKISSSDYNKTIDAAEVKKIEKDSTGTLILYLKNHKRILLPKSINNRIELENDLGRITEIKNNSRKIDFILFIQVASFISIMIIRFIPNNNIYHYFLFIFITATIVYIFQKIIRDIVGKKTFLLICMEVLILLSVLKNLLKISNKNFG